MLHCFFNIIVFSSKLLYVVSVGERKPYEDQAFIKTSRAFNCHTEHFQRGHRECEDLDNQGNFLAILEEMTKHDSFLLIYFIYTQYINVSVQCPGLR